MDAAAIDLGHAKDGWAINGDRDAAPATHDAKASPDVPPAICGDGVVSGGEACDDGNKVDGDGCDSNCTVTACGNGIKTAGEACDDGNKVDGDGCDSDCTVTACGNGIKTAGEACDDGDKVDGDGCDSNCTVTACGNGIKTAGEACDDGNKVDGDGCDSNCTVTACGNGIKTAGEACDDGNKVDGDGCDSNCTVTACGNGIKTAGEACDDGNKVNGDGCDSNCTATACGNGIKTAGEACDDGNKVDGDGCDSNCTVTACGNGIKTTGEACDDGNKVDGDGCDSNCTVTACGNGIKTAGEACDDGNKVDGDGCDSNCTVTACGNGIKTAGEACDDGNKVDGDGCDSNCTVTACGNGIKTAGEACDDGNKVNDDGCTTQCKQTRCHDQIAEPGEICYGPAVGQYVGRGPTTLAIGDFDEDGTPDMVVALATDGRLVFRQGQGDGYFQAISQVTMTNAYRVAVADLDRDGHLDVLAASSDGTLTVLWGDGHLGFPATAKLKVVANLGGVAAGDFDGDGIPDIVLMDMSGQAMVLFGTGDRTLATPLVAGSVDLTGSDEILGTVVVADFNGDGFDDFASPAVGNYGGGAWVFLSSGRGRRFAAPGPVVGYASVNELAVGDLNGDAVPDLVFSGSLDEEIVVSLGNGDGTFQQGKGTTVTDFGAKLTGGAANGIAVADLNLDGHADVVVGLIAASTINEQSGDGEDVMAVAYGDGTGGFPSVAWYGISEMPAGVTIGDLDRDGRPDLAVADYLASDVSVLLASATSGFVAPTRLEPANLYVGKSMIADFDDDGFLDVITAGAALTNGAPVSFFRGHGDGTFDPQVGLGTGGAGDFTVSDVDSDGLPDIVFLRGDLNSGYSILKHMPDGTVKQVDVKCPYDTRSAHVTAFNYGWGYNTVMITEGVNVHIGCNPPSYTFNGGVGNIVTADFDGDGRSDLVVDTFDGPVFMRANGAPGFISFAAPVVLDTVNDYHSLATADFNGDGLPDLAVGRYNIAANGGDRVDVYLGDRTNGLGPAHTASQWRARELAPVDIDGDGIIDLAAASEAAIVVRLGLGDGTFGAERVLDSASSANFGVATGDLNRDGRPDFVASAHRTDLVVFLSDP